ncbi:MAG: type IV pilus assembly protein PilB [Puniceicoccaceae bacterium 5H]|nr:MAG: type IV pilus assembly protein PilB [Puniceicoccaceae bacterium 5H]
MGAANQPRNPSGDRAHPPLQRALAERLGAHWCEDPSTLQARDLPDSPYRTRWAGLWQDDAGTYFAELVDPLDAPALNALQLILDRPVRQLLRPRAPARPSPDGDESPAVQWVEAALRQAVAQQASDLHLEAQDGALRARARHSGKLIELPSAPVDATTTIVAHLKVRAGLDPHERRRSQDGRFSWQAPDGAAIDFRLSCLPIHEGESLVLRVLNARQAGLRLHQLGLSSHLQARLKTALRQPHGLILAVGPTGSGKTTTLYALLQELDHQRHKILTVEDPVEYALEHAVQVNVQPDLGLGFPEVLRAMLRHDPDQILVGEIRDRETARIALQAALTGHLVLSSLHASDALLAIVRLRDLGLPPYLITATIRGVVAQRLVRRRCACEGDTTCPDCGGSGWRGRLGVFEWLEMTPTLRDAIQNGADLPRLRAIARDSGWQPLREAAAEAVQDKRTTPEEVARLD